MERRTGLLAAMGIALACGGIGGPEEGTSESTSNLMTRKSYKVGGTISGLSGTVVLQDSGKDNLSRSINGSFTFATALPNGSTYGVTVLTQPSGQTCTVANGSGTIAGADVTNVAVSCTTNVVYTVSGTIAGLSGTVTLQDNGGDNLSASIDGQFTFATALQNGSAYAVTVLAQPAGQTCTVTNGSGTIAGANVTNVAVSCTTAAFYTVGGTISGVLALVILQDNGADNLNLLADGPFTFATALRDGATYAVTVASQPLTEQCTVTNGSGAIAGANVTNVAVSCTTVPSFFNTGYCIADGATGQLTGDCMDVGSCIASPSPQCVGAPAGQVVQAYCGPLVDQTVCLF